MNYQEWSSADLLEAWRDCVAAIGGTKARAATTRQGKSRNALWAAVREMEAREAQMRTEIYARMGVPADFKKPGMVYYSASKHHGKHCSECGSTGGMNGRYLHWYMENYPMAFVVAHNGGSSAQVKRAVEQSRLLCNRCARKRGIVILASGKPAIKHSIGKGAKL